jgi:hypothetical protein
VERVVVLVLPLLELLPVLARLQVLLAPLSLTLLVGVFLAVRLVPLTPEMVALLALLLTAAPV